MRNIKPIVSACVLTIMLAGCDQGSENGNGVSLTAGTPTKNMGLYIQQDGQRLQIDEQSGVQIVTMRNRQFKIELPNSIDLSRGAIFCVSPRSDAYLLSPRDSECFDWWKSMAKTATQPVLGWDLPVEELSNSKFRVADMVGGIGYYTLNFNASTVRFQVGVPTTASDLNVLVYVPQDDDPTNAWASTEHEVFKVHFQ